MGKQEIICWTCWPFTHILLIPISNKFIVGESRLTDLSACLNNKPTVEVFYLVFLQCLHHQCVVLPELSEQLAPVRSPSEQDLLCSNRWRERTVHPLFFWQGHALFKQVQRPLAWNTVSVRQPILDHHPELQVRTRITGGGGGGGEAVRLQQVVWQGGQTQQRPLCDHSCALSAVPGAQITQDQLEDACQPLTAAAVQEGQEKPDGDFGDQRIRQCFDAGQGRCQDGEPGLFIRWQWGYESSHDLTGNLNAESSRTGHLLLWQPEWRQDRQSYPPRHRLVTQRDTDAHKSAGCSGALPAPHVSGFGWYLREKR